LWCSHIKNSSNPTGRSGGDSEFTAPAYHWRELSLGGRQDLAINILFNWKLPLSTLPATRGTNSAIWYGGISYHSLQSTLYATWLYFLHTVNSRNSFIRYLVGFSFSGRLVGCSTISATVAGLKIILIISIKRHGILIHAIMWMDQKTLH
jgi:hypothetical protein